MADEVKAPIAPVEGQIAPQAPIAGTLSSDGKARTAFVSEGVSLEDTGSERPAWLPEGVDKVEELQDFFEKKGKFAPKEGATTEEVTPPAATEEANKEPAKARTDEEIIADLTKAGGIYADPKYQPHALVFEKTGDLTAEQRQQAATDLNVPLEYVNSFVEQAKQLRQANTTANTSSQLASEMLSAQVRNERLSIIGGEEHFEGFNKWVSDPANVPAAELDAYNKATDEATARALLSKFASSWKQAGNGAGPRDLTQEGQQGGDGAQGGVQGYASQAEMLEDMGKAQYRTDSAFRNKVAARVAASKI